MEEKKRNGASKTWQCTDCHQNFLTRKILVEHRANAHKKAGRKCPCHHCMLIFASVKLRKEHELRVHASVFSGRFCWYHCPACSAKFRRHQSRTFHVETKHEGRIDASTSSLPANTLQLQLGGGGRSGENPHHKLQCPHCSCKFRRKYDRDRHVSLRHAIEDGAVYDCAICGMVFRNATALHTHIVHHEPDTDYKIVAEEDLFEGSCRTYRKVYIPPLASLELTLGRDYEHLNTVLTKEAAEKKHAKCSMVIVAEFVKMDVNNIESIINMPIRSKTFPITVHQVYTVFIEQAQREINNTIEDFVNNGSQWVLNAIFRNDLQVARCRPLSGSCQLAKLSVNSKNDIGKLQLAGIGDNRCFFYAVARHFVGRDDVAAVMSFVNEHINEAGIETPVKISQIQKFESQNSHLDLKINILYKEGGGIYPILVSKVSENVTNHINILLYQELVSGKLVRHYIYINDLGRLLRREYDAREKEIKRRQGQGWQKKKCKKSYEKLYVCANCLAKFSLGSSLEKHFQICKLNKEQKIRVPIIGDTIEFTKWVKKFKIPLIGFFDFEAVQVPPDHPCIPCATANLAQCYHKSTVEAEQRAGTFCIVIINYFGNIVFSKKYSGIDCADQFLETLLQIEEPLDKKLSAAEPLNLTDYEEAKFKSQWRCHICEKAFEPEEIRVRDHCHLTGVFMGAAHQLCNLKRIEVKKVPLFCHNFQGKIFLQTIK